MDFHSVKDEVIADFLIDVFQHVVLLSLCSLKFHLYLFLEKQMFKVEDRA